MKHKWRYSEKEESKNDHYWSDKNKTLVDNTIRNVAGDNYPPSRER